MAYNDTNRDLSSKTGHAADKALGAHNEPTTTGDVVGETTGGLAGAATGAALGSLGGPIGTIIGGIAGAATGWWTGRAVSEAASTFDHDEDYYRNSFSSRSATNTSAGTTGTGMSSSSSSHSYDHARPAYQIGHVAGMNPDYHGRRFEEVETDLRRGWDQHASTNKGADWDQVRGYAADAYQRGQERRLTLSEEQLAVGKRQVQAGEVNLHKTVESRPVTEQVSLTHEEVSIERRPLSADSQVQGDIGEQSIRVPLMAEEAVVDKRVVPVEEVVVRTNSVTENQTVSDTVRREQLDTSGLDQQQRGLGASRGLTSDQEVGMSGAQDRAHHTGPLDRMADKLDDLKDRVDGNPASRPGPDATDRRI